MHMQKVKLRGTHKLITSMGKLIIYLTLTILASHLHDLAQSADAGKNKLTPTTWDRPGHETLIVLAMT